MTIFELLQALWSYIPSRRRVHFVFLFCLMIAASFSEMFSIGAVFPFLAVLIDPAGFFNLPKIQPIASYFGLSEPEEIVIPLTVVFALTALGAGVMRIVLLWVSTRLSFAVGSELSIDIYRKTLYQPYSVHVARNSSEVITVIATKANSLIYNVISPFLSLASSVVMLVIILLVIIAFNPVLTICVFFGFAGIYGVIVYVTKEALQGHSATVANESTKVIKSLQEGLGGVRDVLIDGTQELYCKEYQIADRTLRKSQGSVHIISHTPRYAIETIGMLIIAMLVCFVTRNSDSQEINAIPTLGVLAMAAQRLLPLLQQAYLGWSTIRGCQASLFDTLRLLDQKMMQIEAIGDDDFKFQSDICLRNVSFAYNAKEFPVRWVVNNLSLTIKKGSCVGFIGETGGGKSTVLDILMSLIQPIHGELLIDGKSIIISNARAWQQQIAHVPQTIYLADSSIAENIAFGVPKSEIEIERVKRAAEQAQISETIRNWPRQYETIVGERGVRLSGGQRQRIGIARALYKKSKVLILDEATSALDSETEKLVMNAIASLDGGVTVLIVAHRISTLKFCSKIFELDNGALKWNGGYHEMLARSGTGG